MEKWQKRQLRSEETVSMRASINIDEDFIINATDRGLFGFFIEHSGRSGYGGSEKPGQPAANI